MSLMEKEIYEFGPFLLDTAEHLLSCEGTPVSLTPKAFEILVCLVRNQGRILTKDELLKQIWPHTFVEEVNLAVNISTIRKVLGENPHDCRFIATVPGGGYRFVAGVRKVTSQNGDGGDGSGEARPKFIEKTTAERLGREVEVDRDAKRVATGIRRVGFLRLPIAAALTLLLLASLGTHICVHRTKR